MILNRRRAAIAAAAVLMALPGLAVTVGAQESEPVRVAGSAIAAPLVEAVAAEAGVPVTLDIGGTTAGLAALCAGEAEVALANRPLTFIEESVCASAGIEFYELLLGHAAAIVITHADSPAPQCLNSDQLASVFAPSAAGQVTTWQQIDADATADALSIYLPADDRLTAALLDSVVEGDGARADATRLNSDAEVIEAVAGATGAVGVVDYAALSSLPETVRVVELNTTAAGCVAPTVESFENRTYSAAEPLLAYVRADEVTAPLATALAEAGDAAATAGLVAPSADAAAMNATIVAESNTGREFTRYVTAYIIPEGVTGSVILAGSSAALELTQNWTGALNAEFPNVVATTTLLGEPAGISSLCTGAADVTFITGEVSAELWAACTENGIEPIVIPVGARPVALVANAAQSDLACLTMDEIAAAISTDAATWDQVNAGFAATPILALAPAAGGSVTDLLLRLSAGPNTFLRGDAQAFGDPLYRAAAVANVEGAITFMGWSDYLRVADSGQQGIQLVSVDGGEGCVEPGEESLRAGDYPLMESLTLLANPVSLSQPGVQAALWYLFSDRNFNLLSGSDLFGLPFAELAPLRYDLQDAFTTAEQAATEAATAEITPEATPEATPAS
jgi:phosphate transport system substrate-binding protein